MNSYIWVIKIIETNLSVELGKHTFSEKIVSDVCIRCIWAWYSFAKYRYYKVHLLSTNSYESFLEPGFFYQKF